MRVLQLLPELNAGGVETGTMETARSLVQAGHESIVISAGGRLVKSLEARGQPPYFSSRSQKTDQLAPTNQDAPRYFRSGKTRHSPSAKPVAGLARLDCLAQNALANPAAAR